MTAAVPQRLLFASTGTKDPKASDVLYVKAFAAPLTVNTIPEATLKAFADHGEVGAVMPADGGDCEAVVAAHTPSRHRRRRARGPTAGRRREGVRQIVAGADENGCLEECRARESGLIAVVSNVLVVDVGGTHVKILATGQNKKRQFGSGKNLTAAKMVKKVKTLAGDWQYDAVSIGYPGPLLHQSIAAEPYNLGSGWVGFDFTTAFGCPVKLINDAAMQALGGYRGGRMLFLGFGTGLGTALIVDGIVEPMELGHLVYRKSTYEDYVGARALDRLGKKRWRKYARDVIERLTAAFEPDQVLLGGGNAKNLDALPSICRIGDNADAFVGGFRLWEDKAAHATDVLANVAQRTDGVAR